MKNLYLSKVMVITFALFSIYPMDVQAVDNTWMPGECRAKNGTQIYTFNFTKTITDIKENEGDQIYADAYNWSATGGSYESQCNCPAGWQGGYAYFKGESSLPVYKTEPNRTFYEIDNNLAFAIQSYIHGRGSFYVPFYDKDNIGAGSGVCTSSQSESGGKGSIDLLIIKPFIGNYIIRPTTLFRLYGSVVKNSYGTVPMAQVDMHGTITVSQSCEINSGNSIQVNFGEMNNGNFKNKGSKPEGVNSKTIHLGYKCNLVSQGMDVKMRFTGQNDTNHPTALATTNPDIGVVIEDGNGNPVQPNTGSLPMTLDYNTQTGSVDIITYPVSTTGNIPVVGQFTSRATVVVDFQ